ncbi:MAG: 4a-hydroxytetrahydrobiopterin dehydratase [Bdellovibrionales bacterium]|nr:4a-hydroxytetrahydrobiopterin dehydratase [Bdellovibrionales bacterium]
MSKLSASDIQNQIKTLGSSWQVTSHGHLFKEFIFDDFLKPLGFANKIAALAEQMQHHPDLTVRWGKLGVEIWTHSENSLTQKDFDLAQRIESL